MKHTTTPQQRKYLPAVSENRPGAHVMHTDTLVAIRAFEYKPVAHAIHKSSEPTPWLG